MGPKGVIKKSQIAAEQYKIKEIGEEVAFIQAQSRMDKISNENSAQGKSLLEITVDNLLASDKLKQYGTLNARIYNDTIFFEIGEYILKIDKDGWQQIDITNEEYISSKIKSEFNISYTYSSENVTSNGTKIMLNKGENVDSEFYIEYSTDKNTWVRYNEAFDAEINSTVYARLANGVFSTTDYIEIDIPNIEINIEELKSRTVEISITNDMDNLEGYYYAIGNASYGTISNEATKKFTGLTKNTEYIIKVKVEDNNGNTIQITDSITTLQETEDVIVDLEYSSKEEITRTLDAGIYKLEVWGAQGGNATRAGGTAAGGYGGYSVGIIEFTQETNIYINIGQQGGSAPSDGTGYYQTGGYNGGGSSRCNGDTAWGAGGGATHIALSSGLLSNLSGKRSDILIVAGGGGGAGRWSGAYNAGGSAGGYEGNNGTEGYGGTQNAGGNGNGGNAIAGGFGYGGGGTNNNAAGGGGGFFGGGTGHSYGASAGGGSGYIGNQLLSNKHMAGYKLTKTNTTDESKYTISVDVASGNAEPDKAKSGHGHVKITKIVETAGE